jgi:hypothetical protein
MSRSISPSTVIAQHQHGGSGWNHDVSPIENLDIFWKLCKGCSSATSSATARQQRLVSNSSSASARQPDRGARSPTTGKLTTNSCVTAACAKQAQLQTSNTTGDTELISEPIHGINSAKSKIGVPFSTTAQLKNTLKNTFLQKSV